MTVVRRVRSSCRRIKPYVFRYLSSMDVTRAELDLSSSLDGPIFEPLRDVEYFRAFSIIGHTPARPNGADFAREYLHSLATTPASR
jgi:hypothetical protein